MRSLLVVAVLFSSGCIADNGGVLDPRGTAASVSAAWLIAGAAPSTDTCAARGITHVRVRFYRDDAFSDNPDLVFACELGAFDTRPRAVVSEGTWMMALLAVNANAARGEDPTVASGPISTHDAGTDGGHFDLGTVDFTFP
jgi:hypothetical protein